MGKEMRLYETNTIERSLCEKLIVAKLVKGRPASYGTRAFVHVVSGVQQLQSVLDSFNPVLKLQDQFLFKCHILPSFPDHLFRSEF